MKTLICYKADPAGARDRFTSLLPVGAASLSAFLNRAGVTSVLANFSAVSSKGIISFLTAHRPDIVAISQFTHNRHESIRLAGLVKRALPRAVVLLGGPHASSRWQEQLERYPEIDAVAVGEGEETLLEFAGLQGGGAPLAGLATRCDDRACRFSPRPLVADLDRLPFPSQGLPGAFGVDARAQGEFIVTSRGCFCSCRFCSSPDFWGGRVRFRSPRSMVDEIRFIRDTYGLIYFSFRDDTFTVDRKRIIEFCRLLVAEKVHILWNCQSRVTAVDPEMLLWMRRAGCESIQFGIESGSEKVLDFLGKGITIRRMEEALAESRAVGLRVSIYLMTGIPGEGEEDLRATLSLIERLRPHDGQVSPLAYYPGTEFFRRAVEQGAVNPDIFETSSAPGIYARNDPFSRTAVSRILRALEATGAGSEYSAAELRAQERLVGFAPAAMIAAGERWETAGNLSRAEESYRRLIAEQPDNPWGWLQLGELHERAGRAVPALEAYQRLIELVPNHLPGYEAAAAAADAAGRLQESRRLLAAGKRVVAATGEK